MKFSGNIASFFVTSTSSTAFTDEATTADATRTRYRITDRTKKYWDRNFPITVKRNGVIITTGFTIEHVGGYINFENAQAGTDVITVSGRFFSYSEVGQGYKWSIESTAVVDDVTDFASAGRTKDFMVTTTEKTASCEWFWGDERFFTRLGSEFICVFFVDDGTSKRRYEGYGYIESVSLSAEPEAIIRETLSIQLTDRLYYREGEW